MIPMKKSASSNIRMITTAISRSSPRFHGGLIDGEAVDFVERLQLVADLPRQGVTPSRECA